MQVANVFSNNLEMCLLDEWTLNFRKVIFFFYLPPHTSDVCDVTKGTGNNIQNPLPDVGLALFSSRSQSCGRSNKAKNLFLQSEAKHAVFWRSIVLFT